MKQTLVGFAAPPNLGGLPPQVVAPAAQPGPAATALYGAPPAAAPAPAAPAPAPMPVAQKTMLGVARPGIAPLHPGEAKAPAVTSSGPPRMEVAGTPRIRLPEPPAPPKSARLPRTALILLAVGALLAVAAAVVALLWPSPRPLLAEVTLDDRGNELLLVTCDDCPDGTALSAGSSRATFAAKKAKLPLERPLTVGKNDIAVGLRRPGIGRDEDLTLSVSVDYRVRGDLTGLSEDPPKVRVLVQAAASASVIVDGQVIPLDAGGKGTHTLEVAKELEGPADAIVPFEKRLPYTITAGGAAHQGEVTLRFGIVPLRIEAPGESIVVDGETFMLSGRTLKDGRISVSGRPITVDTEGRFAQLMNVSSVGETTIVVRAEAKDQAPRLVRVKVKRVSSLRDEAEEFRRTATTEYSALTGSDAQKGLRVALQGEVVEARRDGQVTVLLIDAKKGCPDSACLAKIIYGGRFEAKKGAALGAYGRLGGMVEGPRTGATIPQVFADFLLPGKAR